MQSAVCAVVASAPQCLAAAEALASRLRLPLLAPERVPPAGFVLQLGVAGLALQRLGRNSPGPIRVEFASGAAAHRRRFGGGKGQMIARAVGLNKGAHLRILDATAGLGGDAFVLASLGCDMTLLERSPIVAELLADGLLRGKQAGGAELQPILARMRLERIDSRHYLTQLAGQDQRFDVVYLDPMFPERRKSASVKKEMAAFHSLLGTDPDADDLLPLALAVARCRVVVKRPRSAPFLGQYPPTFQLQGKTSRYDIYVNASIDGPSIDDPGFDDYRALDPDA